MNFKQRRDRAHKTRMQKKGLNKIFKKFRWYLAENVFRRESILSKWMKDLGAKRIPGSGRRFIEEPMMQGKQIIEPLNYGRVEFGLTSP